MFGSLLHKAADGLTIRRRMRHAKSSQVKLGHSKVLCVVSLAARLGFHAPLTAEAHTRRISTTAGLCALFLHVAEHTGDRTAVILVSALIVTTSFQADLGLGSVQYLIWFDCWLERIEPTSTCTAAR